MFTEEELYSLLEEAFEEGYNSALEEVEEAMNESEDSSYDLEDEMDSYAEADEYEYEDSEYPELFSEARDDTKFDKIRKAAIKGAGLVGKELGFSRKTLGGATRASLAATSGKMDPKVRAKQFAKNASRALVGGVKDADKVATNTYRAGTTAMSRAAELAPYKKEIDKYNLEKKSDIAKRLYDRLGDSKFKMIGRAFRGKDPYKNTSGHDEKYYDRQDKKYIADKIKLANKEKERIKERIAKNKAEDAERVAKGGRKWYTKSGKFWRSEDDDKKGRGSRAVY